MCFFEGVWGGRRVLLLLNLATANQIFVQHSHAASSAEPKGTLGVCLLHPSCFEGFYVFVLAEYRTSLYRSGV